MATLDFTLPITETETYSVAGKQLKLTTEQDIKKYVDELVEVPHLKKIDFSGNTIGIEASKSLAEAIKKNGSEIEEVNFSDFYTGRLNTEIPQSLEYLLPALLTLPKLSVLNLSDNAFGLQTIDPIEKFIPNAVALEHLILSNNGMGPFAGARIGKALFKLAHNKKNQKETKYLKTFICGRNRLENGSINYLALGLKANENLETIKLYQNGIRPAGISKLVSKGLSNLKNLRIVDLQDNTITKKSSSEIAKQLEETKWANLKELNLNDALLQKQGGYEILKALLDGKPHSELKTLKLQFNELDYKSLELLPLLIEKNLPSLEHLEINGNVFDEDSQDIIAINEIFDKRGFGELDELDELEEPDSEEEDEEQDEEQDKEQEEEMFDVEKAAKELLEELQKETKEDKEEDDLVAKLQKTHIA